MKVITDQRSLETACTRLAEAPFIAVDTEFMREKTYYPQLCLIQAAGGDVEAIIDPLAPGLNLKPFFALMADPGLEKVFHAARQDVEIFVHLAGDAPRNIFDTQIAGMALGLGESIAYDSLVRARLGRHVDKGARFTDWSKRPLSERQLAYALEDVTHLRDLFPGMRDELLKRGRLDWLREDMAFLSDRAQFITEPEDAWKRLKIRRRTPEYLAALNAAAAWRERMAQEKDLPRGRLLKDEAIMAVAEQRPRHTEALSNVRGVPQGFANSKGGRSLMEALLPAYADPASFMPPYEPPPPSPPNLGPAVDLLKVLLRQAAETHGVAARLIGATSDLERLAATRSVEDPLVRGWRGEVFGEDALRLMRGEIALCLKGKRVVATPIAQKAHA